MKIDKKACKRNRSKDRNDGDAEKGVKIDGNKSQPRTNTRMILLLSLTGAAVVIAVLLGVFYSRVTHDPEALFVSIQAATPEPPRVITPKPTSELPASNELPAATLTPYEQLLEAADLSMMKDIVNILLIGIDYAEERESWSGKHAYHSDVMMVLAINFKENAVDMISLPRDTYAQIPGVSGIYKLNAAVDCAGGYPEGLYKVAEAASWMLGGIPVDYYYAVTMPVVKELVDAIDGVDYDIDVSFELMGRAYEKGMQHMDGQAVLDYMRVRKNVQQAGDLNRINRQKKMLIAIFSKMKTSNMLVKLPQIITAFNGKLLSNTSLEQTAALAVFGYGLPEENIRMHSMDGPMRSIFNWNFCLTDQKKRVQLIVDIYGVEVPQYKEYASDYCLRQWAQMRSGKYFDNADKVIAAAEAYALSNSLPLTLSDVLEAPALQPPYENSHTASEDLAAVQPKETIPSDNGAIEVSSLLSTAHSALSVARGALSESGRSADEAMAALVIDVTALADAIDYGALDWAASYKNEVQVDFR